MLAWLDGAGPRYWPLALAPALAGSGAAARMHGFAAGRAALALVVALALLVGVTLANDAADGVRGTDEFRFAPPRLVGGGTARPGTVRAVALAAFAVAAVAGVALAWLAGWWLLAPGLVTVAAGWCYASGPWPYARHGLGPPAVALLPGVFGTLATAYTQAGRVDAVTVLSGVGVGLVGAAVLMVADLHDLPGDEETGKRTLAVLLGEARSRAGYLVLLAAGYLVLVPVGVLCPWGLLGLASAVLLVAPVRTVLATATGRMLRPAVRDTSLALLHYAALLAFGLGLAAR